MASALSGVLFGAGLAISQMTNPDKVLSFLDITGSWDPSLAFVMGAALAVSGLAYAIARRRATTFLGAPFDHPTVTRIDGRLIAGAVLFGIGWGAAGFCPGPAIAAIASGAPSVFVFVGAMALGIVVYNLYAAADRRRPA